MARKNLKGIVTGLAIFIFGLAIGIYVGGNSLVGIEERWSIGIYRGSSPLNFPSFQKIENPVLTYKDVKDAEAEFVADPFMVRKDSVWYMFFEVKNRRTNQGDIALAVSRDGIKWDYRQIVLDEPFHLSYPYVFSWGNDYYMIPESYKSNSLRLYKAVEFPLRWEFVSELLSGNYVDPSIFHYKGKWWLFAETNPSGNDTLSLYFADDLRGPWVEHPQSPVIEGNANIARPGGRVLVLGRRVIRYTQDDSPRYGNQVRAFEITKLTPADYEEREVSGSPILTPAKTGWNADGMHQIDPHWSGRDWIACVDGYERVLVSKLKRIKY